jgi:(heptosyl)LPS beta-1,4-glucosyltransferase
MPEGLDLSVCITVKDEAVRLPQALASCEGIAREIVVVDTGSRDATVEIARAHPKVRLYEVPFEHFSQAHGACLERANGEWVLVMAADERVSPELAAKLGSLWRSRHFRDWGGFKVRRRNHMLGRVMTSMGLDRDYPLRLFRREGARYNGRFVHEGIELPPGRPLGRIDEPLEHHMFEGIDAYLRKIDLYTTLELREGVRRHRAGHLLVTLPSTFLRFYVARGGWRDGFAGYLWASLTAIGTFVRDVKLWIAHVAGPEAAGLAEPTPADEASEHEDAGSPKEAGARTTNET